MRPTVAPAIDAPITTEFPFPLSPECLRGGVPGGGGGAGPVDQEFPPVLYSQQHKVRQTTKPMHLSTKDASNKSH